MKKLAAFATVTVLLAMAGNAPASAREAESQQGRHGKAVSTARILADVDVEEVEAAEVEDVEAAEVEAAEVEAAEVEDVEAAEVEDVEAAEVEDVEAAEVEDEAAEVDPADEEGLGTDD